MAHRWCLLAFLAMVTPIALQWPVNSARSAELSSQEAATPGSSRETPSTLDTVTIEARREREIKRQIDKFVFGGVAIDLGESLERWNQPICPVVAGPRKPAEFIFARVSQIARDSGAHVGSEHCQPNLFVVITENPDLLLEKWYKRQLGLFNTCKGFGSVKKFLHSRQPVRVFYNAKYKPSGDGPGPGALALDGVPSFTSDCLHIGGVDTWLHRGSVQELTSVIIIVDSRQTTNINTQQLADYIAMVGLAQIRLQPDLGTAPSILHLFRQSDPQPLGLSLWDEAFLHSLYATDQSSVLEVAMIQDLMFKQIVGR